MKAILFLITTLLISCGTETNGTKINNTGDINFTIEYSGNRSLKRVMVAFYKEGSDIKAMPDIIETLPKTPNETLIFPYVFSIAPKNGTYKVKVLADDSTSGAPNFKTASFSQFQDVIFMGKKVELNFKLDDPITCENNKKRCNANSVETCNNGEWGVTTSCSNTQTCNDSSFTCIEETQGVGEIHFTVNYAGDKNLKRVMIAYYYDSDGSGFPDEKATVLAPTEGDVIVFPYTFSVTPTENRTYYISLKADEKTSGMPTIFGGIEAAKKEVIVISSGVSVEFTLQ